MASNYDSISWCIFYFLYFVYFAKDVNKDSEGKLQLLLQWKFAYIMPSQVEWQFLDEKKLDYVKFLPSPSSPFWMSTQRAWVEVTCQENVCVSHTGSTPNVNREATLTMNFKSLSLCWYEFRLLHVVHKWQLINACWAKWCPNFGTFRW